MFAINHAATALIFNRRFEDVSLAALLVSVQAMEFAWVVLNYLGVEHTTTEPIVRYVGDIHLAYMPYSHSVLTALGAVLLAWSMGALAGRARLGAILGFAAARSWTAVAVLLVIAAAVASYVPARRASAVQAVEALGAD